MTGVKLCNQSAIYGEDEFVLESHECTSAVAILDRFLNHIFTVFNDFMS